MEVRLEQLLQFVPSQLKLLKPRPFVAEVIDSARIKIGRHTCTVGGLGCSSFPGT
jgi:hypothetical protein